MSRPQVKCRGISIEILETLSNGTFPLPFPSGNQGLICVNIFTLNLVRARQKKVGEIKTQKPLVL